MGLDSDILSAGSIMGLKRVASSDRTRLAGDFRLIGNRFEEYARQASKAQHLVLNLHECAVRAARLLINAIDADCFPEAQADVNGGWWDRQQGRLPGGVLAVSGGISWSEGDPAPNSAPDYLAKATQSLSPDQLRLCWTFAIGSWLVPRFPDRFRHNAESWDWTHIATDQAGQPLGRDGKPLRKRWYKDGKPLSTEAVERLFINGFPSAPGHYEMKTAGEFAHVGDSYDQSDSLAHHRIRAEVYADACRLLASLIESKSSGPPSGRRKRATPKWKQVQRKLMAQFHKGCLQASLRMAATAIGEPYSTIRRAALKSPTLSTHFGLSKSTDEATVGAAGPLDELASQADARTRAAIARLTPEQRKQAESVLQDMDTEQASELIKALAKDPDAQARIRGAVPLDENTEDASADGYTPRGGRRRGKWKPDDD